MMVNSDFIRVVEASFPREKDHPRLPSSSRSTSAANMLQQAGYQDVANLLGGFGGMRDQTGKISAPGLPVSKDSGEGVELSLAFSKDPLSTPHLFRFPRAGEDEGAKRKYGYSDLLQTDRNRPNAELRLSHRLDGNPQGSGC
jgi:hypothetical protein